MKVIFLCCIGVLLMTSSCVTPKKYHALEKRHANILAQHEDVLKKNAVLQNDKVIKKQNCKQLKIDYENALAERDAYREAHFESKSRYENLKVLYNTLIQSEGDNNQDNIDIVYKLAAREQHLLKTGEHLEKAKKTLQLRSKQIVQLERLIASRMSTLGVLENTLKDALVEVFTEGYGSMIHQNNYIKISINSALLFKPKTIGLSKNGKHILDQLSRTIAPHTSMNILVEGHTNNVPFTGKTRIPLLAKVSNNWQLSLARAVTVINFMKTTTSILPENLHVAGRGEQHPISSNTTPEGRSKNDRITIIITPKQEDFINLLFLSEDKN